MTEATLFGVSMGGAISGVALPEAPGLSDHWFAIEPVGSTFETYLERTAFWRALSGALEVEDVTIVHALYDGLVPYDESRELQAALRAHDLPRLARHR